MDHCPQVLHFGWRLHLVSKAEWILGLLHGSHFSGLKKFLDFPVIFFIFPVFFLNVMFFKPKTWSILVSLKIIINICLTFSDFSSLFKMSWRENPIFPGFSSSSGNPDKTGKNPYPISLGDEIGMRRLCVYRFVVPQLFNYLLIMLWQTLEMYKIIKYDTL